VIFKLSMLKGAVAFTVFKSRHFSVL